MRKAGPSIRVTADAAVFFLLLVLCDCSIYTLLGVLAAAIHELGHLIALRLFGVRIRRIIVCPGGVELVTDGRFLSYRAELFTALAGPMANVLAALLLIPFRPRYAVFFFGCHLVFGLINLLPIRTLDGGRALDCLLSARFGPTVSASVLRVTTWLFLLLLWLVAIWGLFYFYGNFSLFLFSVFLFLGVFFRST